MTETWWGTKGPGEHPVRENEDGAAEIFILNDAPDWVRLPSELGGARVRVLDSSLDPCPCQMAHSTVRHTLDHLHRGKTVFVSECEYEGFLWHTMNGNDA